MSAKAGWWGVLALALAMPGPAAAKAPAKAKGKAAKPPPKPEGPEWWEWAPRLDASAGKPRAFLAVGRSAELDDAAARDQAAEEAAHQAMGPLIARWQEASLACAQKASETQVQITDNAKHGSMLSFTKESSTEVGFYNEQVEAKAVVGKRGGALLRQELAQMLVGFQVDGSRSANLREAVKLCGEKAFDALAAEPPPAAKPQPKPGRGKR